MRTLFSNWRAGLFWTLFMMATMGVYHFVVGGTPLNQTSVLRFLVTWTLAGAGFTILTGLTRQYLPNRR